MNVRQSQLYQCTSLQSFLENFKNILYMLNHPQIKCVKNEIFKTNWKTFCLKIAKIFCVNFFFLFGFFDIEDTFRQNFDRHSMICTYQAHFKNKFASFFDEKCPQNRPKRIQKHFRGQIAG